MKGDKMAQLLQCDGCHQTERADGAFNWLTLDWQGEHVDYVVARGPVLPLLFCSLPCVRRWAETALEHAETAAQPR